jgi:hypothetical protein
MSEDKKLMAARRNEAASRPKKAVDTPI